VTPFLALRGASRFLDFANQAFDAKVRGRLDGPAGTVLHAEVQIGDAMIMVGEPMGDMAPITAGLYVYVDDVDATYKRALAAGARSTAEPTDEFWGDRHAGVVDEFGNSWSIAKRIEEVSPEEIKRRAAAFAQSAG
jgi:uncharacterized glyoxalase superfamily protein PhnB